MASSPKADSSSSSTPPLFSQQQTATTFGISDICTEQWLSDEEKELQLRHVQEQHRLQFGEMYGQTMQPYTAIPAEVDVTKRPDCIDDMIALVVAVCMACPDCAQQFWSTVEEEVLKDKTPANDVKEEGGVFTTHLRFAPN
eukprot:7339069-Ditylum_brightwellii.AAC.1